MSLKNKVLTYKTIIIPLWSYDIRIWGQVKPYKIKPIQVSQFICLRQKESRGI